MPPKYPKNSGFQKKSMLSKYSKNLTSITKDDRDLCYCKFTAYNPTGLGKQKGKNLCRRN